MQDNAAHMRVIIIEQMTHLAIDGGSFDCTDLDVMSDDIGARRIIEGAHHAKDFGDGRVARTRQGAACPIHDTALRLSARIRAQSLIIKTREKSGQLLGDAKIKRRSAVIGFGGEFR